mgnify:CR=1 FL=1
MQYRNFTKDNLKVSSLGFGCMRLPTINNDPSAIDEKRAIEMIRFAIDNGVNYVDTAYNYHQGNSEITVGKALKDGYRQKTYLATKSPVWLAKSNEDFKSLLNEQLKKLDTDYIDFYLLHSLNSDSWDRIKDLDVLKFLDEAKASGKIKYAGFSFHDQLDAFKEIIDSYNWDFCQIQLNYLDKDYQAGEEGLEYAYNKGVSVVIMEPIKGGKLSNPSFEINELWDTSEIKRTPAEWALRWVLNHKEVSILLSGMSTIEQVKENINTASNAKPKHLSKKELEIIDKVTNIYQEKVKVGCTGCEYCLPCPKNISIPNIFEIYNELYVFDSEENSKDIYKTYIEKQIDALNCIECGQCESMCPQNIEIRRHLKDAHKALIR